LIDHLTNRLEIFRKPDIVSVQEGDQLVTRLYNSSVSSNADALMLLMDNADPGIVKSLFHQLGTAVG
jgi:hypothetical protein